MIIGENKIELESTSSTNYYATMLLKKEDVNDGTVIITEFQDSGKGHSGSKWESAPGKNLLFSIILYPNFLKADQHFYISKFISIAICKFVKTYIPETYIKWPNDIFSNNKKICGILIENVIEQSNIKNSIIGIGLNVNQKSFIGDFIATSVFLEIDQKIDLKIAINKLILFLNNEYENLKKLKFKQIDNEYLKLLFRYRQWAYFKKENQTFEGKITGIAKYGELIIKKRNGETFQAGFKEVVFV